MARKCKVCSHKKTKDIENDIVQGMAHTQIGKKYGLDHQSVRYHSENHLPDKLVRAVQDKKANHAENILDGINNLLKRTKDILDSAEEKGHNRLALDAIKEARGTYELLSKIAVKLEEYRRKDKAEEVDMVKQNVERGLHALSTAELKTYIQLQGKIASADPEYELDAQSRYVVNAMNTVRPDVSSPKTTRTRPAQDKNIQNDGSADDWDEDFDLELDDLELDELDEPFTPSADIIPSEETDPAWLKKYRKENPSLPKRGGGR